MNFWILLVMLGLEGATADVSLSKWNVSSPRWWVVTSVLWLIFMTGFGWAMKLGADKGYPLTISVVVVLLADIIAIAIWDTIGGGVHFTSTQWFGALLAIAAILCLELGKK